MINTSELRKGVVIEMDGKLYYIVSYEHIKVGRGSAQVRIKMKDVKAGHQFERTFQAGERFSRVRLDRRVCEFLYREEDQLNVMDTETFDQFQVPVSIIGDQSGFLKEGMKLEVSTYEDLPITAELPFTVDLQVTDTPPGFKGDTASGGYKPATIETGVVVQVPFFVKIGDVITVDTRDGSYKDRVMS